MLPRNIWKDLTIEGVKEPSPSDKQCQKDALHDGGEHHT